MSLQIQFHLGTKTSCPREGKDPNKTSCSGLGKNTRSFGRLKHNWRYPDKKKKKMQKYLVLLPLTRLDIVPRPL